jgi:hypothetical protein
MTAANAEIFEGARGMSTTVKPFRIAVGDDVLDDLKSRLRKTRWPEAELVDDWSQGTPLKWVQEVCRYWAEDYDWRRREALLNRFAQFTTEIDGLDIHFVHVRSPHPEAMPLIITHGWPGSIVEFHKVIEPLTNPTAHGGTAADAFHVVCPGSHTNRCGGVSEGDRCPGAALDGSQIHQYPSLERNVQRRSLRHVRAAGAFRR